MTYSKLKYLKLKDSKLIEINKLTKQQKRNVKKLKSREKQAKHLSLQQIKNDNPTERLLRFALQKANIDYDYQKPFFSLERYVCVDFYLPESNVVIEVDGTIHVKREVYDIKRTIYLKRKHGVSRVVRFTNKQIVFKLDEVIKKIQSMA